MEKKGILPGIVPQKGWENEAFQGKGLHWEKGSPKVESLLLIRFPKEEGNLARAARALGRNQQEVVDLWRTTLRKRISKKDKGRPIILPNGVKVFRTMKYENWQGLYEPLNQDQLSRQRRRLVVTQCALKAVRHCGPSVIGSR